MRIIHTSDWHLGQHFMGKNRIEEHEAFLAWLLELIDKQRADALVVAGDVFDTGTPPSYARTLYNEFIVSLQRTGCSQTLILGGNHDSEATLNEARSILACLNTRVTAGISENPEDHVLVMNDRQGNPGLIVCAVPFIRPRDLIKSLGGQSGGEKQRALGQAVRDFYTRVFTAAGDEQARLAGKDSGRRLPVMATGHLTVVGGKSSESVRDIYIGSLDAFPASGFPDADYVALGHLHRAQQIKHKDHIRYSGSPIPLSFDEGHLEKQVLVADFQNGALAGVSSVPVPCFRRLVCLKGKLEKIGAEIKKIAVEDQPESLLPAWLEAEVEADDYLTDLQDRIQAMIENEAPDGKEDRPRLELLRVRRKKRSQSSGLVPGKKERLEELTPKEVFARRLAREDLDKERAQTLNTLFDQVLEQVQGGDQADIPEASN